MALVEEDKLLNAREAARMLGISPQTVYIWNAKGFLPNVRLGPTGRVLRFRYSDLAKWMGERNVQGALQERP